jgi:hypothetical protein
MTLSVYYYYYWCSHGRTEKCMRPGQANNLGPLQTHILKTIVQHLFSGGGKKLIFYLHLQFSSYAWSGVWKRELTCNVFPIYSSDVLAPL